MSFLTLCEYSIKEGCGAVGDLGTSTVPGA